MNELEAKRALVTGASRRIGAALALELADKGADVANIRFLVGLRRNAIVADQPSIRRGIA